MATNYQISFADLSIIRTAATHMGLTWQSIAARPASARVLVDAVNQNGIEDGCEAWGDSSIPGSLEVTNRAVAPTTYPEKYFHSPEDGVAIRDYISSNPLD